MTKVKFCGLRTRADVDIVNEVGSDFAGFIVTHGFKRTVGEDGVRELAPLLRKCIVPVGVFVDDYITKIESLANDGVIGAVQLHGSEDDDYILRLKSVVSVPIVRSFVIRSAEDVEKANQSKADMVLLDSGQGTGKTFDWTLLDGIERDFILAGGLDAGNVGDAIARIHPAGVDTSSKMETDGTKDYNKVKAFADAVRAADAITERSK